MVMANCVLGTLYHGSVRHGGRMGAHRMRGSWRCAPSWRSFSGPGAAVQKVGLVATGALPAAVAARLVRAGYHLTVYDVASEGSLRAEHIASGSASLSSQISEAQTIEELVEGCDVVVTMLGSTESIGRFYGCSPDQSQTSMGLHAAHPASPDSSTLLPGVLPCHMSCTLCACGDTLSGRGERPRNMCTCFANHPGLLRSLFQVGSLDLLSATAASFLRSPRELLITVWTLV